MESSTLKEALSEIKRLSQNPETVRMAISREIHLKDQLQREEDAELRGIEIGRERVREEEIEKGKHLRNREIILNMHAENLPAESISRFTQTPLEEVKGIIESNTQ